MTREEAIETLRANYPDKCYESLRNAVDIAIEALKSEPKIRCGQCVFWNRQHISVEGFARCLTGESGIRYRKSKDYCSYAKRKDEVEKCQ